MQIHSLNIADRTFEMERKSHYDASQTSLEQLEQRVDNQIEAARLTEENGTLQTRLNEVKKENKKLNEEL